MGTKITNLQIYKPRRFLNKGYISCASRAALKCLKNTEKAGESLGLLISTAVFRDKHLVEPALASLILGEMVGNPIVGTGNPKTKNQLDHVFGFDLSNGACGLIQAIQMVDAYVQSGKILSGLVVAGDSIDQTGDVAGYTFSKGAAALLLSKTAAGSGFVGFQTDSYPIFSDDFKAKSFFADGGIQMKLEVTHDFLKHAVDCAQTSFEKFLDTKHLKHADIDMVICSQYPEGFGKSFGKQCHLDDRMVYSDDQYKGMHTSAPLFSYYAASKTPLFQSAKTILFLVVGSGVNVSMALYKK